MENKDLRRTLIGQSFGAWGFFQAGAASYSNMQLWNPAASGVILVVRRVLLQVATGGMTVNVGTSTAACSSTNVGGTTNKLFGGAAPLAQINMDLGTTRASPNIGLVGTFFTQSFQSIATLFTYDPTEPYVIPAGKGLIMCSNQVGAGCGGGFEWFEVPG